MTKWVDVNGATVEKDYFDENVREANQYEWRVIDVATLVGHAHCMICGIAIDPNAKTTEHLYKSIGGHLCNYCHDHFVK